MPKNPKEFADLFGAMIVGEVPETDFGPFGMARLAHVIGSGGVLRHCPEAMQDGVLRAVTGDVGGGWKVPAQARTTVDTQYLLFAAGLLADVEGHGHDVAARVARQVLTSESALRR